MGKILIIADIAEKKYFATPRGLELAHKLGLRTEVVAFTHAPLGRMNIPREEHAGIRRRLLDERREAVQARIDRYRKPDQKVSLKVVWQKDIVKWVAGYCASGDFDAVVKTAHRTESLVYTPTDWQLLRECPAAVLLVAEKKWHRTKPILAAVDLSSQVRSKLKLNHKIVETARFYAGALNAELRIVAAIEVPTLLADMDLVDSRAYAKEARQAMQPQIRALSLAHDIPERLFHCKRGPAAKVITSDAARVRAQLVVLGTVARRGISARLMGNTAEEVLTHLKTDVLAIKP